MTADRTRPPRGRPVGAVTWLEGQTVGDFTITKREPAAVHLRCAYGHEREVRLGNIARVGKCMACNGIRQKSAGRAKFISLVNSATMRQIEVRISIERGNEIMRQDCAYCGLPADEFNGIDRVDSRLGYVEGNMVGCCSDCNFAKRSMSAPEFKAWIIRVYKHSIGD